MASAFAECEGPRIATGLIAGPRVGTRSVPVQFEWLSPGHPAPDEASEQSARRALDLAVRSRAAGTLVVLLSGGASAMLALPVDAVTLDDKARTSRALMNGGLAIDELNCVRKHLSAIKGGRLAAAAARVVTLAISDVHGPVPDDPSVIGSGPTVPDTTTFADALAIVSRPAFGGAIPAAVIAHLAAGARGAIEETPKPGDPHLMRSTFEIIGTRRTAMEGAARAAAARGYAVRVVEAPTTGHARGAGAAFAADVLMNAVSDSGPVCVIASGETTVRVIGDGRGGRNQEFTLAAVPLLERAVLDHARPAALASVGTDGIDGPTDAAGALADSSTGARARGLGLDAHATFARNASYDFFNTLDDLIRWGPTGTNVGDVHIMLMAAGGTTFA